MRYILKLIAILLIGCTTEQMTKNGSEVSDLAQNEIPIEEIYYEFISDSIGFNSPEDVAKQVIEFLQKRDTAQYLEISIPLDGQKYLFSQNFEYRPEIKDQEEYLNWLESRFERRVDNFLKRAGYILEIMEEDKGFQIENATIDTITSEEVRIKNYGGFNRFLVGNWAEVTVKMNFNGEDYFFEIPQIIKIKGKWFLYYPEYYLRTKTDWEFIEERKNQLNKKADEFWL